MRKIGVIGGMGPDATAFFFQKILKSVNAQDDKDHIPLLIDNNPQIPSRIAALIEGNGESPLPCLIEMAQGLAANGAEALAMPCNTAHHYADEIAAAVDIPFIHMVRLSAQAIANQDKNIMRVGLLPSPATKYTGVFDNAFASLGLNALDPPLYPPDDEAILSIIKQVKAGHNPADLSNALQAIATDLIKAGAHILMIACTELSLIKPFLKLPCPILDSLDILTDEVVAYSKETP